MDSTDVEQGQALGEDARRAVALKLWGMERAGDSDPEGQAWARTCAALSALAPFVAALVAAAEERGAAKERERCSVCGAAASVTEEKVDGNGWIVTARECSADRAHGGWARWYPTATDGAS